MAPWKSTSLVLLASVGIGLTGCAGEEETPTSEVSDLTQLKPKRFAPDQIDADENWALWSEYCIADQEMTQRPMPNYENPVVMQAAEQLSRVARHSFSLYGDIKGHHKTPVPEELIGDDPENPIVTKLAHEFLGYTCGEFRDRATMVEAKIRWVAGMNYLDDEDTGEYDPAGDPWAQMKAADYHPYLSLSRDLWYAKRGKLEAEGRRYMMVGEIQVDTPVPAQTVCETKYMFAEYLKKDRSFDDIETFEAGYGEFREINCTLPDDEDYYYDFRGDSNLKPNSPESNGMLWISRTISKQCDSRLSAEQYSETRPDSILSDAVCQRYYRYPFTTRWNAARAGLATWVLVDPDVQGLDSNSQFNLIPRYMNEEEGENYIFGDRGPYRAENGAGEPFELLEGYDWRYGAMGLPELHENNKEKINKIIQLAVDRHTDWYNSGYNDHMGYKNFQRSQAYSPFVASSYEMSESDNFVTPGTTVQAIDPTSSDYKHWMFVFKVHKDNWYTPEHVNAQDVPIPDFDRMWFDETAFGNTGLANSEKGWDRMGTALEDEHSALLYLHNLPAY